MKTIWGKLGAIVAAAALVAVLVFSYVSAITNYDFTVFIFAGAADQETNRQLIEEWADRYAQNHPEIGKDKINVGISFQSDTNLYFSQVQREIASGKADDVFYVSPKYVKSFALNDAVLDLTGYVNWDNYDPNGLWAEAIGAYAFVEEDNSIGNPVTFYEAGDSHATDGAGFYNADGNKAGVYALPKDFSSFGLAYNRNFFSQALREKYTSTIDTRGAVYDMSDNQTNIINIGETTRYYPFNYYKYSDYQTALEAGDPIAAASDSVGGYDVTIMGWPGDTYYTGNADDPNTSYDERIGYVTYTYAEYGAMAWAVGYYAQFYDIVQETYTPASGRPVQYERHVDMTWLNESVMSGNTELYQRAAEVDFVYGNDQYEGTLYLTAWLLGNDVDIISDDYRSVRAGTNEDGSVYGIDSEEFKEAYAAFLAFGSDWNANSFYSGSGESTNTIGGWGTFNSGRCIFYGCGTWDMATFNSTTQSTLAVGVMPEPVADSYSPYAKVKGADYKGKTYGTAPVTDDTYVDAQGNYTAAWKENMDARQDQWAARLDTVGYGVNADVLERYGEDGWQVAACADLCAYLTLDPEMQRAMTYSGSQLTSIIEQGESYLYYQQQGQAEGDNDGFEYMITPDGNATDSLAVTEGEITKLGRDDITPASLVYSNGTIGDGVVYDVADGEVPSQLRSDSPVWTFATAVAQKMYDDHRDTSYRTVREYITAEFPSLTEYLNTYFMDSTMGEVISLGYAFKCLNLIALNYEDRNLQLRMVSGNNGALDSCMYTYNSQWIDEFGAVKGYMLIAYDSTRTANTFNLMYYGEVTADLIINPPNLSAGVGRFFTPAAFCDWIVDRSQALLDNAVAREESIANQD